ncbi:MAG TPA: saccharopine dehydrogenase C-terminal domain-containing protein [Acidobacteriota bacterium]|nr:saccharopine dehydrogenase C-terminal domain-containing protein [Acidobacteriota bacterium]
MSFVYGVLGAGRQGTASGYDIARFGDAEAVIMADSNGKVAEESAARINRLVGKEIARGVELNAKDPAAVAAYFEPLDSCVSAIPYFLNFEATKAAIAAKCHFCDMGGNTGVVMQQLGLHADATQAGVSVVPDCGVGPGMISNLAVYLVEQFEVAEDILIYDGGLLQQPRPPFNFALFFNIEGLTNEYWGDALYLVDGKVKPTACFADDEYELIEIPGLGMFEAFVTSGGLSTMVPTYEGKLKTLKNKALRYPGHVALFKGLRDIGLFNLDPIEVGGVSVVPRQVLHTLLDPKIAPLPEDKDMMVIHIVGRGQKGGAPAEIHLDIVDRLEETTGFYAMERMTGFHAAIVAQMMARGEVAQGAVSLEKAVNATRMVEEMAKRDMNVTLTQVK